MFPTHLSKQDGCPSWDTSAVSQRADKVAHASCDCNCDLAHTLKKIDAIG